MKTIETQRLILREWKPEDLIPFAEINQDPKVMECLLKPLTLEESAAMMERMQNHFKEHGFGPFACVVKETDELIGFVGLYVPNFEAHFTPCVEIGWRLSSKAWGKGYATEAARAVLKAAFGEYGLREVVSFTVPKNLRSIAVMEKIGMKRDMKGDFLHPKIPAGHPLHQHILYRITRDEYNKQFG
ncbi:MAG: GNAT family N-acetyltransferase [Chlamydiales bacterium]|nr:GNAT family N-acetyltransferase [Chlamydiales bacterium]